MLHTQCFKEICFLILKDLCLSEKLKHSWHQGWQKPGFFIQKPKNPKTHPGFWVFAGKNPGFWVFPWIFGFFPWDFGFFPRYLFENFDFDFLSCLYFTIWSLYTKKIKTNWSETVVDVIFRNFHVTHNFWTSFLMNLSDHSIFYLEYLHIVVWIQSDLKISIVNF